MSYSPHALPRYDRTGVVRPTNGPSGAPPYGRAPSKFACKDDRPFLTKGEGRRAAGAASVLPLRLGR